MSAEAQPVSSDALPTEDVVLDPVVLHGYELSCKVPERSKTAESLARYDSFIAQEVLHIPELADSAADARKTAEGFIRGLEIRPGFFSDAPRTLMFAAIAHETQRTQDEARLAYLYNALLVLCADYSEPASQTNYGGSTAQVAEVRQEQDQRTFAAIEKYTNAELSEELTQALVERKLFGAVQESMNFGEFDVLPCEVRVLDIATDSTSAGMQGEEAEAWLVNVARIVTNLI